MGKILNHIFFPPTRFQHRQRPACALYPLPKTHRLQAVSRRLPLSLVSGGCGFNRLRLLHRPQYHERGILPFRWHKKELHCKTISAETFVLHMFAWLQTDRCTTAVWWKTDYPWKPMVTLLHDHLGGSRNHHHWVSGHHHHHSATSIASCHDSRDCVRAATPQRHRHLLHQPTENQYLRTDKPRLLWQGQSRFLTGSVNDLQINSKM